MISKRDFVELIQEKSNAQENLKNIDLRMVSESESEVSGVLVIIHFHDEYTPTVIFTKRSQNLRNHAGEISFPGGRVSNQDRSVAETAIRETFEEIGLLVQKEHIMASLAPINTYTTRILIYPFIVILGKVLLPLEPNEEVEQIIEIPLEVLRDCVTVDEDHSDSTNKMFKFNVDDYLIWGATARILKNLIDLVYSH